DVLYRKKFWKEDGERCAFPGLERGRGRRAGFCSEVELASLESEVRCPAAGFAGFASGASGAAAGSAAAGWTLSALPRGQLKSSARPPGAATGSPLVSTRETVASTAGGGGATAADEFFRSGLHGGQRHHRSGQRPLRGAARLGIRRLRAGIDRHRQRNRHAPVGYAALDFALDVVGKLAGTELGVIDAVAAAQ